MLTVAAPSGSGGTPAAITDGGGGPTCGAQVAAVLYWISPFGPVGWRRAERYFLSRWLVRLLANARRSSAARKCSAWSRQVLRRSAGPPACFGEYCALAAHKGRGYGLENPGYADHL